MVFGAILRVSRSAQRRSAADREAAAAAAATDSVDTPASGPAQ